MKNLPQLLENNKRWAEKVSREHPGFFQTLSVQQAPKYMWIGCADSRVPANQIVDLLPGEVFVHRNVANVVVHSDFNCLSALQFAVDILKVEHVMVVGHYGCGGVKAAMDNLKLGLVDNWVCHVRDVHDRHRDDLGKIGDEGRRFDRLCELNVLEQAMNVCRTTVVREAWRRGQDVTIHGWVYALRDGLINDLGFCASGEGEVPEVLRAGEDGVVIE
jgi:carbonic anhydrase